jgi:hypothetical protein
VPLDEKRFLERLERIGPDDEQQLAGIAHALLAESRDNARRVVALWRSAEPDDAAKLRNVIVEMAEQTILPLLNAAPAASEPDTVWLLRRATQQFLDLQAAVRDRLVALLDDVALVPPPPLVGRPEVEPPPVRICDVAYLQLRRMLSVAESTEDKVINSDIFLSQLDFEERSLEIARFRASGAFRHFVEDGVD